MAEGGLLEENQVLAPEIKREKAKGPEELDQDAFLRHHYTGHIASSAYSQYEKEGDCHGWGTSQSILSFCIRGSMVHLM